MELNRERNRLEISFSIYFSETLFRIEQFENLFVARCGVGGRSSVLALGDICRLNDRRKEVRRTMLLLCDKMSNSRSTIASLRWPHNIHRVRACDERQRRMQIRQIRLLRKAERDLRGDGIFYEIHWRNRLEEIAILRSYCTWKERFC